MRPAIYTVEQTSSTNAWIENKNNDQELPEGSMVIADFQSGGRGQAGNAWESKMGMNLLCSVILHPNFLPPALQFHVSRVAALACYSVLSKFVDNISLKWPNDIYYKDQKMGGILIENSLMGNMYGHCILGIGINLNQEEFESEAPNPVSLIQIINKETDIQTFASLLQEQILFWYNILKEGDTKHIESAYFDCLYRREGKWLFSKDGEQFKASIEDVEESGQLVLKTKSEIQTYWFKEVEFVI